MPTQLLNAAIALLFASYPELSSVLLARYDQEGAFASTSSTARVGFVLGLFEDSAEQSILLGTDAMATTWPYFQPRLYWGDGATGTIEFTAMNDPNFGQFAAMATDGVVDQFVTWEGFDPFVIGGHGGPESELFGTSKDLTGYSIDLVRLEVNQVRFLPNGPLGNQWDWRITYEFYGTPVPEPCTLVFVGLGVVLLRGNKLWRPPTVPQ